MKIAKNRPLFTGSLLALCINRSPLQSLSSQGSHYSNTRLLAFKRHNREFDIMIAYGHDRLGRSNTLDSWVVENVILSGAQIYLIADGGYVDLEDFRYKLTIGGMIAAAAIDRFVKACAPKRGLL